MKKEKFNFNEEMIIREAQIQLPVERLPFWILLPTSLLEKVDTLHRLQCNFFLDFSWVNSVDKIKKCDHLNENYCHTSYEQHFIYFYQFEINRLFKLKKKTRQSRFLEPPRETKIG